jgi:hypothetical protein
VDADSQAIRELQSLFASGRHAEAVHAARRLHAREPAKAHVGVPELACETLERYERRAVDLASDHAAYARVRRRIEMGVESSSLFDARARCRELEWALTAVWERYQRGLPAQSLAVPAQPR